MTHRDTTEWLRRVLGDQIADVDDPVAALLAVGRDAVTTMRTDLDRGAESWRSVWRYAGIPADMGDDYVRLIKATCEFADQLEQWATGGAPAWSDDTDVVRRVLIYDARQAVVDAAARLRAHNGLPD